MSYDPRKWAANDMKRRPRRRATRWMILFGILLVIVDAIIELCVAHMPGRAVAFGQQVAVNPAIMMPLLLGASMSPFAREAWMTPRGLATYDEFERDALQRAMMHGYQALLVLVAVVFGWLWLATLRDWPRPTTPRDWSSWCASILLVGVALPILFAEMLVPVPPEADEWEEDE